MNEFQAKKLGEVLAFDKVGMDTIHHAMASFDTIFGKEEAMRIVQELNKNMGLIQDIAKREGVWDIVSKKAEGTGAKLTKMREVYVGDQWDNPSEIAEWLGFFEGAAYVHWNLVEGAGEASHVENLRALSDEAVHFHKSLLEQASNFLKELGKTKK
ncbi:hypothetical protein KW782_04905 [Candidatus Parcubacteria bacterium]|nr:hypothetical protein [Candidatus Parcubacteria bacterium]